MTAAGVPAADDSGRGAWRCPVCRSARWVSVSLNGGLTRQAQCVPCGKITALPEEPTPARPGTAELQEEIARAIVNGTVVRDWQALDVAGDVVATDGVQRLLAVEQRVRDMHQPIDDGGPNSGFCAECTCGYPCPTIRALGGGDDA